MNEPRWMALLGSGIVVLALLWGAVFLGGLAARYVAGIFPG